MAIAQETIVGVISDTHGLLRPEAIAALAGSQLILHAGDIGSQTVLDELEAIAPVVAVRGNNDKGSWAEAIPEQQQITVEHSSIYLLHILKELTINPATSGVQMVISGHSHKPLIETREGVIYLNPGSAGPRRFKLPISLARLHIHHNTICPELVELSV